MPTAIFDPILPSSPRSRHASLSLTTNLASSIKSIGQKPKPNIEIQIADAPQNAFQPLVYTSLDEIRGEVCITAQADLHFEDIYITFEGFTRTFVEKMTTASPANSKTEAFQTFLRLMQPFDPDAFPEPRVLEANKAYKFPFVFVVPSRLLPQSCTHSVEPHFDRSAHLGLPPTLGDSSCVGGNKSLVDDMTPDMGCIAYSIKCRITSGRGASGKHVIMAEKTRHLRIIPAMEEEPPLDVRGGVYDDYRLRKEKSIRKGIFRQKLGKLIVESVQPQSLRLPGVRSDSSCAATTMATVNVRFDPLDEAAQPPRLNTMVSKLKAATFYTTVPMRELPMRSTDFHYSGVRGLFVDTIPLSCRCLANTTWQKHDGSNTPHVGRSDTTMSTASTKIPAPSDIYNPKYPFYTAHIVVPVSLPRGNRIFVPSFHSCLVSRVYALDFYISVNTPNATVTDPTVHIKVPIQISSEGGAGAGRNRPLTAQEANAIAAQEVNEFFEPRSIAPPTPDLTERSSSIARPGPSPSHSPRIGTDDPSPFSSPRVGFSNRDSIAEEPPGWSPPSFNPTTTGLGLSSPPVAGDYPPSPGPGYTHRSSSIDDMDQQRRPSASGPAGRQPSFHVRMVGTQQRFQSLSFENEEDALAPPPGYERNPGRSQRRTSNRNAATPPSSSRPQTAATSPAPVAAGAGAGGRRDNRSNRNSLAQPPEPQQQQEARARASAEADKER